MTLPELASKYPLKPRFFRILLQIRKIIRHEKREKATMGLQGEKPENPCGST